MVGMDDKHVDTWVWGSISASASARGRQCFLLQLGIAPVRTGRFRIAWLDEDGEVLACWSGNESDPILGGWGSDRTLVLTTEDDAKHELTRAVRSFGDRRDRRVEIVEMA